MFEKQCSCLRHDVSESRHLALFLLNSSAPHTHDDDEQDCPKLYHVSVGYGSGLFNTSLARTISPSGHLFTFDFHVQRAYSARANFERNSLDNLITVSVRDIQGEGFPNEHEGCVNAVLLDLPQPWLVVPSASNCLKPDVVFCSSPRIEQARRTCETITSSFSGIRTFEVLLHSFKFEAELGTKDIFSVPTKDISYIVFTDMWVRLKHQS